MQQLQQNHRIESILYLRALPGDVALAIAIVAGTTAAAPTATATSAVTATATSATTTPVPSGIAAPRTAVTTTAEGPRPETASAAAGAAVVVVAALGRLDLDFLAVDGHAVELVDGVHGALLVGHGDEGVALAGDVHVGDISAP